MASYPRRDTRNRRTLRAEKRQVAAGIFLGENPNDGKRHASNGAAARDLTESARITESRHEYRPLTVHTPIRRARIAPLTTSYTI